MTTTPIRTDHWTGAHLFQAVSPIGPAPMLPSLQFLCASTFAACCLLAIGCAAWAVRNRNRARDDAARKMLAAALCGAVVSSIPLFGSPYLGMGG